MCRRMLGCLLLLIIIYGATVEAAHSHGTAPPERSGFAAISDAGGPNSDTSHSQQKECELCQFQQHLSNSIARVPLFIISPSTQLAFASTLAIPYSSTPTTRPSGRAPPLG